MNKGRMEAFSDGVMAIIITIMVLELKPPPEAHDISDLIPIIPVLIGYTLSFVFLGIYWNNHHHLLQAAKQVDGRALWANLHLLFWLSLIPFATGWIGETKFAAWAVSLYGFVLLACAIAYTILSRILISLHGNDSVLAVAVGNDRKGQVSLALYLSALPLAFVHPWIACALYIAVAIMWLIPDPRIEKILAK